MPGLELTRISGHTFLAGELTNASTVLDLGANRGAFARGIRERFGCRVHSVEPTPGLADALARLPGIEVHRTAVSELGGELLFRIDPENSESSAIVTQVDEHTTVVPGTTLEALADRIGSIDLLKMDVEGAEIGILRSTPAPVLTAIRQLTVEFHDFKPSARVSKAMVRDAFARMRALGFAVFVNTLFTYGDVLFVNHRLRPLRAVDRIEIALRGRWLPGAGRVARRWTGAPDGLGGEGDGGDAP